MAPSSLDQWRTFLQQCFIRRLNAGTFRNLAQALSRRAPLTENSLLEVILGVRDSLKVQWDPLLPLYVDDLIKAGFLKVSSVLGGLLKHSSIRLDGPILAKDGGAGDPNKVTAAPGRKTRRASTIMIDTRIIQDIKNSISGGNSPKSTKDAANLFALVAEWILALTTWHNSQIGEDQPSNGLMGSPNAISLFESLGNLFEAVSRTERGLEALSSESPDGFKIKLGQALNSYIPLCAGISLSLRNQLDSLQKGFNLFGEPTPKPIDISMMEVVGVNTLQFEASVMNGPVINSRAGLYIYINAMLVGRPLVDDSMLLNYLFNRYGDRHDLLVENIITATFDVLSNAMYRNESSRAMFVFRSFLVNKLPPFLATMAATSMEHIAMELCISHALSKVDPNAFPSFSQMFEMQSNTMLSDVRQEFLFSCASHKLIPESSIERLLGENPMQTLPSSEKYGRDELIAELTGSPDRADQLIEELELMEGNAGTIVAAITQAMLSLCNHKETMTLKTICNSLSRRPQVLDVILLFRSPKAILQPLCSLLDAWKWDEEQGENQPVYDEFGSILLLILAFKYRYDLNQYDLGISNRDSFILKLLDRGSMSQKLNELGEAQNKNLGAWISALFIAEGISEETMCSCSPQEFYMLVSTLFSQSVGACEIGKLEFDTLKGGFEYLLEPFLLPSLVIALGWLGNYIWESELEHTVPLKVLNALVKPNSISGEAEAIHRTVLNITARTLEERLKDVRIRDPTRNDIKDILDALDPYLSFQRNGSCRRSELESWTAHAPGGLLGSIRNTFQLLVMWSSNPETSMSPHSYYTHRQLLAGIRILGATRVLDALIDEVNSQTEAENVDLALDIAATFVCSPLPESFVAEQAVYHNPSPNGGSKEMAGIQVPQPRWCCPILTLRDAVTFAYESLLTKTIADKDSARAKIIIRLSRRVNVLVTPPAAQVPNLDMTNIIEDMELDAAATDSAAMDLTGGTRDVDVGVGVGIGVGDLDPGVTGPSVVVGDDGSVAENDIDKMLSEAAASAAVGGLIGTGSDMDTSIDDMLNAVDMVPGNPEFLDLDMEGMF